MDDFRTNEGISEFRISCTIISTNSGGKVVMVKDNRGPGARAVNVDLNGITDSNFSKDTSARRAQWA